MFENVIELLSLPFMQRAIIGGSLIALLASFVGVLVVLKRSSFFGDTIAHTSLAGVALGLLLGVDPTLSAAIFVVLVALSLPFLERETALPLDNLLGFVLPFAMAIGVVILSFLPGYQPELISFLFGDILTISWVSLLWIAFVGLFVAAILFFIKDKLVLTIFDEDQARLSGINTQLMNTIYSMLLALTIVVSIKLVGIILVNALLIIPATTIRMHARSLRQLFLYTPILSLSTTLIGLVLSSLLNLPSGPAITLVGGGILIISVVIRKSYNR